MPDRWAVHVTVAAIIERESRFLMVRERDVDLGVVINQPAGHLEANESLQAAIVREVREETGYRFTPEALVGIYLWAFDEHRSYLRVAFCGQAEMLPGAALDPDIISADWLTLAEIQAANVRSPLVMSTLNDYRSGRRLSLDCLATLSAMPDRD